MPDVCGMLCIDRGASRDEDACEVCVTGLPLEDHIGSVYIERIEIPDLQGSSPDDRS